MARHVLDDDHLHAAIRDRVASHHQQTVEEVRAAVAAHDVVVVGMGINPFPRKVRKALAAHGVPFHYLSYGSYFGQWRHRTALKMWTGWPTFPMVFVRGTLVGGCDDTVALIASGELDRMLGRAPAAAG
jgi:glutaredoxin-related protein